MLARWLRWAGAGLGIIFKSVAGFRWLSRVPELPELMLAEPSSGLYARAHTHTIGCPTVESRFNCQQKRPFVRVRPMKWRLHYVDYGETDGRTTAPKQASGVSIYPLLQPPTEPARNQALTALQFGSTRPAARPTTMPERVTKQASLASALSRPDRGDPTRY